MVDNADNLRDSMPWHPMTDAVSVKTLGKLNEEAGELVAATARCIIQGIHEYEPITGVQNSRWLANEIADVLAGIELAMEYFHTLDPTYIQARKERKKTHLRQWHRMA